jgi:uncharacterized protein
VYYSQVRAASLQIVRKSSFVATPWKNGGGITHEAIRVPPSGAFMWRVSVAQIEASGPFSDFAGYRRTMVLLDGAGIALSFGDGAQHNLLRIGDLAVFDGGMPTRGELLAGPCTDLNLMVDNSLVAHSRVERLAHSLQISAREDETTLVFSIEQALLLETESAVVTLAPWDLAVFTRSEGTLRSANSPAASAPGLTFIATVHP